LFAGAELQAGVPLVPFVIPASARIMLPQVLQKSRASSTYHKLSVVDLNSSLHSATGHSSSISTRAVGITEAPERHAHTRHHAWLDLFMNTLIITIITTQRRKRLVCVMINKIDKINTRHQAWLSSTLQE
jgi:hypothetical protein